MNQRMACGRSGEQKPLRRRKIVQTSIVVQQLAANGSAERALVISSKAVVLQCRHPRAWL